ncbi:deoxyribodipyrimidine photolyase [Gimesia sp.]|uniref:deoxyribodipyrimidine photolyase n=1 Tax=Gimesia sp. TaxID=2024833 RepID=UPI000C691D40|nr:deoxyribodipyrimidine photolyase [Gimesia sp.]MAX36368.1 deoxyribodipyrimidine photolyase [Gimesia sp.]HBL45082.1 deoxyribodipyrimidine photolyase [Planctomycetaceae bacterium]
MSVPEIRIRTLNQAPLQQNGDYVLYWMIANRRTRYNFSLQRAVDLSKELNKPLLVFEALRCGYEWASDRLHRFVLQGMADNRKSLQDSPAGYYCYVEPEAGHGAGLLAALSKKACVVVTDDFPCFFIPHMLKAVAPRLPVRLEAIDSNGLLPLRAASQIYPTAYAFRRFLHIALPDHLDQIPKINPMSHIELPEFSSVPKEILKRWPMASDDLLQATPEVLADLPLDHRVGPADFDGGMQAADKTLKQFLNVRLERYAEERNLPEEEVTSGLSPYLHFGHISVHEVFKRLADREHWDIEKLRDQKATGKRAGWWQMSETAEGFLDELITWRELGYNMCWQRDDYDQYESLPDWARTTLEEHASDQRDPCYSLEEFEQARTHDALWNAAQTQLVTEGRLHNYMRMLWGKKILHWSESPQAALEIMIHLNNKYAVDGRNPNSYSGIFWCLGRYDRAWGPERPIFGKIRYMTSENTARKFSVDGYLERYGKEKRQGSLFD